ncbi:LacI family DNA-binding transcriptional regulator [Primorskyibacter aestuariivivens]|uniref:LacI family DNA-binding transcriptional regulator n=1 Tax=Primorskyibacter aestuariivivens TaxID=1888912 RepID=UPI0023017AB0|nr:LacI family DNA-binding transcriptional regulator [Primorskyibacter aestuariivivens]MDA7430439.1 LacI family DNA-binding transcriptional regulator [Primorskyibacter aestuariivivens]
MSNPPKSATHKRARRVKLADVATAAGVHYSTVSRVLRPGFKGRISDDVAERVRAVARELGYQPNAVASSLRTQSTRSIGLIVHDMNDPIYPPILSGIESVLSPDGYAVLVGNTGYGADAELDLVNRMAARLVDGIFLATTRLKDPAVERCVQLGIPLVSVLRQTESGTTPAVMNDCFRGMEALTSHIIDAGHRDIAAIIAPQDLSTAQERWQGVQSAMRKHGLDLPEHRIARVSRMSTEEGERATKSLLDAATEPPGVIICVNDLVAIGAIRACRLSGLDVPWDISISGYNDIPLMDMINPPLSTVHMHLDKIGKAAGEMMLEYLANPELPARTQRFKPEVILRGSLQGVHPQG